MTFSQLAYHNIVRNKRMYAAHFWSSAFSVLMFFTYALLLFHPDLDSELASSSVTMSRLGTMGLRVSQVLLVIFSFFFILYSVGSFLKTRNKEFGILMMHGMSHRQFRNLVFIENMLIGCAASVTGIAIGLLFSKFILAMISKLLAIDNGLSFYVPVQAVVTTLTAFLVLFVLISLVTSRMVRVNRLIDLLKGSEKPKPDPQASVWLSLLAILLIGAGYMTVFSFATGLSYSLIVLMTGVVLVVVGTYFLFTQLSVYVMRALKRKERMYFKKTNLLTISELAYRLKDNAKLFFIVAVISAVAFTAIGTCTAIGNQGLAEMTNPYAFTYYSYKGNEREAEHAAEIKKRLDEANVSYREASAALKYAGNDLTFMKLSDYNNMAAALGYETETLTQDNEAFVVPTSVYQERIYNNVGAVDEVQLTEGKTTMTFQLIKVPPHQVLPQDYGIIQLVVVSDAMYDKLPDNDREGRVSYTVHGFVVDHWEKAGAVTDELMTFFYPENQNSNEEGAFSFVALYPQWVTAKQANGLLLLVSVLIGVVFFTFAASFLYFRLYTDRERDQQQVELLSKIGLTRKELHQVVTRQLLIMFFLPIVVAVIHSGVAFAALQQLVHFSVGKSTLTVLASFFAVQIVYFLIIRWRYLRQLQKAMV